MLLNGQKLKYIQESISCRIVLLLVQQETSSCPFPGKKNYFQKKKEKMHQSTIEKYKYPFYHKISSVVKKYSESKHKEDT